MIGIVLFIVILVLLIAIVNVYFAWARRKCPDPIVIDCPPCPKLEASQYPDPNRDLVNKNAQLSMMVRYLTLIIKKYEAEKELYKLSHGYHQVYNSPKMEYLKKEIHRMIQQIKSDPASSEFFSKHLNNIID